MDYVVENDVCNWVWCLCLWNMTLLCVCLQYTSVCVYYLWSGQGSLWWRDHFDWPILRYIWSRSGWLVTPGTVAGPADSSRWKRPPVPAGILGEVLPVLTGRSRGEPRPRCSRCSLKTQGTDVMKMTVNSVERPELKRHTRAVQRVSISLHPALELHVEDSGVRNNQNNIGPTGK